MGTHNDASESETDIETTGSISILPRAALQDECTGDVEYNNYYNSSSISIISILERPLDESGIYYKGTQLQELNFADLQLIIYTVRSAYNPFQY